MNAKMQRTGSLIVVGTILLLLCMLIGFDLYPSLSGNDPLVIQNQVLLQLIRAQYLSKDILILKYLPPTYHVQSISDLQSILPGMEQTQAGLLNGDNSLGLPGNPSDNVKRALIRTQNDYLPLIIAFKIILAHPDNPVDPIELNIILMHDRPYATSMYGVNIILQQEAEATTQHLIIIKVTIKTLLILIIFWYYAFVGRQTYNKMVELEEHNKKSSSGG